LSFRDVALFQIFTNNLKYIAGLTQLLQQQIAAGANNMDQQSNTLKQLDICLQTYHKSLTFDYVAVLLNETMEDPCQTNVSVNEFTVSYSFLTNLFIIATCSMGSAC